jgi:hypothetical protein
MGNHSEAGASLCAFASSIEVVAMNDLRSFCDRSVESRAWCSVSAIPDFSDAAEMAQGNARFFADYGANRLTATRDTFNNKR